MRNRAFHPIAAILSVLLLAGTPVHAGPVAIREVIQVVSGSQNAPELRLRSFSSTGAPTSGVGVRVNSRVNNSDGDTFVNAADNSAARTESDTLLAGITLGTADPQSGVDVIDQGNLEGTICDCGEITVPGGFPKWPLLFLAAIPFFFLGGCDDCELPTPTPTPTPTPETAIPEPASLLLLGTGLVAFGARMRRRYTTSKLPEPVGREA